LIRKEGLLSEKEERRLLYKRRIENPEGLSTFNPPVFEDSTVLHQRVEDIERDAYEKGFSSGHKAGLEMAEKEVKLLISRLEEVITQLISFRDELQRIIKPQILELAIAIARRLAMKEIEREPEILVKLTEEALKKMERQGQVTIKINPLLKEVFEKHSPGLMKIHSDIVFDIDPTLPAYGSVVMSPDQVVITDIDEQLRNLVKELSLRL